jgi:hypothetical protein
VTTIASRPRSTFSGREVFDLATIVAAGAASTVFFLIPIWTPLDRATAAGPKEPHVVATQPTVVTPTIPTPTIAATTVPPLSAPPARTRSGPRAARPSTRPPEFVQLKAEPQPLQSKITRFLLGDGGEPVRPFPLARQRRER